MKTNRIVSKALLALALTFGLSLLSYGQALLAPMPIQQFLDSNGKPLAGGLIFTFSSGTLTPLDTFTDFTGTVKNTNPIQLDSSGFPSNGSARVAIWLQSGPLYRVRVSNSVGVQQYQIDGISGILGSAGNAVSAATTVAYVATPVFTALAQQQLFRMTLTGNVSSSTLVMTGISIPSFITFEWSQDSTGSRTVVYPVPVIGASTISAVANDVTSQTFYWNGTNAIAVGPAKISGGKWIVDSQKGGTVTGATLTGASNGNSVTLLNAQGPTTQITGDGTDKTIYTYTIPANTIGPGKGIRISGGIQHGTGSANVTPKIWFGGSSLISITAFPQNDFINLNSTVMNNPAVQNAQLAMNDPVVGNSVPTVRTGYSTAVLAVDTTATVIVKMTCNTAGTDTCTGQGFVVTLIQ